MRHEKPTEVSVSYLFRADDYTVVMETIGMKYDTKNTKKSNKDCKSYGTIDLSFKLKLKSFHNVTHRDIKLFRHNKFLLQ